MPTPAPACLPSPARFSLPAPAPTPPRPGLRHLSLYQVGELTASAPCQPPRTAASVPTPASFSAPAGAMSAPTSLALRGLRQPRLPRRPTCPPLRSSSKRNRAIQRRPVPVRWSARKDTPTDENGLIPQASSPPAGKLGHQDAAGCHPSAGQHQPTAPAAPHQRQGQVAARQPCQSACRLAVAGPRGLVGQAGMCQRCPPLPLPAHLHTDFQPQQTVLCRSSTRKMQRQPSRQGS